MKQISPLLTLISIITPFPLACSQMRVQEAKEDADADYNRGCCYIIKAQYSYDVSKCVDNANEAAALEQRGQAADRAAFQAFSQAALTYKIPMGFHRLGDLYECGIGVEEDKKKALEYFLKAHELGDTAAQEEISHLRKVLKQA